MNYTYILLCSDGTLYTGWTNNFAKRLKSHNSGKGAKYTRGRGPVKPVYLEVFATKEEAMQREATIKKLKRPEKDALVLERSAETEKNLEAALGVAEDDKKETVMGKVKKKSAILAKTRTKSKK